MGYPWDDNVYGVGIHDGLKRVEKYDSLYFRPLIPNVVETETIDTDGKVEKTRNVVKVWKNGLPCSYHRGNRYCDNEDCTLCSRSYDGLWETGKRTEGRKHIIMTIITEGYVGGTIETKRGPIRRGVFVDQHLHGPCKQRYARDHVTGPNANRVLSKKEQRRAKKLAKRRKPMQRVTSVWAIPEDEMAFSFFQDRKQYEEAIRSFLAFMCTTKREDESPSAILGKRHFQGGLEIIFSYLYMPHEAEIAPGKNQRC